MASQHSVQPTPGVRGHWDMCWLSETWGYTSKVENDLKGSLHVDLNWCFECSYRWKSTLVNKHTKFCNVLQQQISICNCQQVNTISNHCKRTPKAVCVCVHAPSPQHHKKFNSTRLRENKHASLKARGEDNKQKTALTEQRWQETNAPNTLHAALSAVDKYYTHPAKDPRA